MTSSLVEVNSDNDHSAHTHNTCVVRASGVNCQLMRAATVESIRRTALRGEGHLEGRQQRMRLVEPFGNKG